MAVPPHSDFLCREVHHRHETTKNDKADRTPSLCQKSIISHRKLFYTILGIKVMKSEQLRPRKALGRAYDLPEALYK
ncbi:hypothetical protein HMPREF1553_01915 [Porphyromonas gingivalis F0568]|nr:hypothetical protein HMPREF1553_01915 [Porphyromonas gingivalis F0568]